ncbi:MAG: flagellar biosynthetic protein FliR [Pseudomonadota bacterium]
MAALAEVLALGESALAAGIAVFLRVVAAVAVLPAFGEQSLSVRIRLAAAVALTVLVAPAVAPHFDAASGGLDWPRLIRLLGSETIVGLTFGLVLRLLIHALQITGTIAAQSTSLAQLFGGASAEPLPAIGHLLVVSGLALAAMADLHVLVVEALIGTYSLFPPGAVLAPGALAELGVAHVGRAFALAFTLAAPFVIGALVYNLALGAINRAMPQLMVAFVGAPAITGAGLALLALVAPLALEIWADTLRATVQDPFGPL